MHNVDCASFATDSPGNAFPMPARTLTGMGLVDWVKNVLGSIVAVDRSSVEVGFALRCTVGVAIPLVIAAVAGHPRIGFAPAVGALIAGFTSLQGIYRSRIAAVLAVSFGVAIASFIGAIAAPSISALVLVTAIVGYLYGTIFQLGMPAGVAALNTTVAFIIFSSLPLTPRQDFEQSSLLLAGGLIQALLLLIVWPIDRFTIERRGLAAAYRELAGFARSLAGAAPLLPPIAALSTARQIAADQQPLARARDIARFNRTLGQAEALRHRLAALAVLRPDAGVDPPAEFLHLLDGIAEQLGALAAILDGTLREDEIAPIRERTVADFDAFERAHANDAFSLALVRNIAAHLLDATQGVAVMATGRPLRLLLSARPRPAAYIQTRVDWFSRDAVRLAGVLGVATLVGHTAFSADRGYWIALTAALVLRPDLESTIVRGFARIAGTLLGAVLAALALVAFHGDPLWQIAGMIAAAAVCYLTLMPNYALFSTFITVFVVVSLNLGFSRSGAIEQRVLDTLLGGALAMAGYVALPSWVRRRTRPLLVDMIDTQRAFSVALLDAYAGVPAPADRGDLTAIRTRFWKTRTEVETAIDRARAEPDRPRTIGTQRALDILAATQSFGLVSMALESGLETMPIASPMPALATLRDALDRSMREIADALRDDRPARLDGWLEAADARLTGEPGEAEQPAFRLVTYYASGYLQSVEKLARLTHDPAQRGGV